MGGIIRVYMSNCTSAFSSKKKKKVYELETSRTEAQHTTNCASQTVVMMGGIIRVYMFNCTSAFSSKKKNNNKFTSLRPVALKTNALSIEMAR